MLILGITGRSESGKSTSADTIVAYASQKGLFAKSYELSQYILAHCISKGLIPQKTRNQLSKEEVAILVQVGEGVRQSDPEMWIKRAMAEIHEQKPEVSIVPNIRRPYEADMIRRAGGYIIRATSLNKNGSEFISPSRDPNHELESGSGLIQADYFLTTRRGESTLLKSYARTLFDHIFSLQPKTTDILQSEFEFAHV